MRAERDGKWIRLGGTQNTKEIRVQEVMDDSRGLYFWLWQVERDGKYDGIDPHGLLEGSGH